MLTGVKVMTVVKDIVEVDWALDGSGDDVDGMLVPVVVVIVVGAF